MTQIQTTTCASEVIDAIDTTDAPTASICLEEGALMAPVPLLLLAPNGPQPSDTSDETDTPEKTAYPRSNAEFLSQLFGQLLNDARPLVTSFSGNPHKAADANWTALPWMGSEHVVSKDLNAYFTLATYRPHEGRYHRREKDCAQLFGVMLDDLGTKAAALEDLDCCPPSVVVETSPGNYQALYLFKQPTSDIKAVAQLNKMMVAAGLCDPGAQSPATRNARLPFGINGKYEPAFNCKLITWAPQRKYSVEELIEGLGLATVRGMHAPRQVQVRAAAQADVETDVFVPAATENEVLVVLKAAGLYKRSLAPGKHDITCPWVHEHTDAIDHGTVYFEPAPPAHPLGGFRCQHSHGEKYHLGQFLGILGVSKAAARNRPTIKVQPGELYRQVDAAEHLLAQSGRYYQRGGLIVSVQVDPHSLDALIKPMHLAALGTALSREAWWVRYDQRTHAEVPCEPPARCLAGLEQAERYDHLPALLGIARQPFLRHDGQVVIKDGFDADSGLYGVFKPGDFNVPTAPSREDAFQALEAIRQLLREFPFQAPCDEAAALAGVLTAAIRPVLPLAPMFHVRAPQIASGKSYLTSLIAGFAGPQVPGALSFPASEEECAKILLATLMEGASTVNFDNLTDDLRPFKSLCSALTEHRMTGRILGLSKMVSVGTRALFLSSGNNVGPVEDMGRRCLTIVLSPQMEQPATRRFAADPLAELRGARALYVSHALTILSAFAAAGYPRQSSRALATYGQWDQWVRQALLWLEVADPAMRIFEQLEHDPDRELLGAFLKAARFAFGGTVFCVKDLIERAENPFSQGGKDLEGILDEVAGERGAVNRNRLGHWLRRHADRIVGGLILQRDTAIRNAVHWKVKSVSSDKSDVSGPLPHYVTDVEVEL